MNISQAETSRDLEISCRKREMSRQNDLREGNVSLEYGDECYPLPGPKALAHDLIV